MPFHKTESYNFSALVRAINVIVQGGQIPGARLLNLAYKRIFIALFSTPTYTIL